MRNLIRCSAALSLAVALIACANPDRRDDTGEPLAPVLDKDDPVGPQVELPDPAPEPVVCPDVPGTSSYCDPDCLCNEGEGDCDEDADCAAGLFCHDNMGEYFGFEHKIDVCLPMCPDIGLGSSSYCSAECPCDTGEGDCDGDGADECVAGLNCVHNVGDLFGFDSDVDVCLDACDPILNGTGDFCSPACPCDEGQGDCDGDEDCVAGHQCDYGGGVDYGMGADVDVCVPVPTPPAVVVDWGECGQPSEKTVCQVELSSGQVVCTGDEPTSLISTSSGLVYRLDMSAWTSVAAIVDLEEPVEWTINLGNSPTNNGWGGDSSSTSNDSEMHLRRSLVRVYANDPGGSGEVLAVPGALDPVDTTVTVVCDGFVSWNSSANHGQLISDFIFQIDGDEPDTQNSTGINDQYLWLGIERTVGSSGRSGDGVQGVTLIFGR